MGASATVTVEGRRVALRGVRNTFRGYLGATVPAFLLDTDVDGNSGADRLRSFHDGRLEVRPLPHEYLAHLSGAPVGHAEVTSAGLPPLRLAAPLDYDGPGDAWSPEHLLLASVQGCFLLTFRAIAKLSQLPFVSLAIDAAGTVNKQDGVTRFTEIVLRPVLTVPRGIDHARAQRVLERSETACLISASLSTPIRMEPQVRDTDTLSNATTGEDTTA